MWIEGLTYAKARGHEVDPLASGFCVLVEERTWGRGGPGARGYKTLDAKLRGGVVISGELWKILDWGGTKSGWGLQKSHRCPLSGSSLGMLGWVNRY